jgi:acyl carrier protein
MTLMTDSQIRQDILDLLSEMADDWEYDGELTETTHLLTDLGLESLDLVVLGTSIQGRYGRLPFADRDVSVGELVAFVCMNRSLSER